MRDRERHAHAHIYIQLVFWEASNSGEKLYLRPLYVCTQHTQPLAQLDWDLVCLCGTVGQSVCLVNEISPSKELGSKLRLDY